MKIALFGGRFDPIHNGHLAVAQEVLKVGAAQEVWFSLENQHQWRPIVASWQDRKAMLELAISSIRHPEQSEGYKKYSSKKVISSQPSVSNNITIDSSPTKWDQNDKGNPSSDFKVDLTPIELGGLTETISVMRKIKKKYSQNDFLFVVGSDQLEVFDKWTHWQELLKEVHFLVVARKGSPLENIPANATVITDPTYEPLDDSATRIREYRKLGKSISGLVPERVEEYIISHGLYL